MTRSSSRSSSSSGSSTPSQSSPVLLSSFDPFAVHPFTNYSSSKSNQPHTLPHPSPLQVDAPGPSGPYGASSHYYSSHHHSNGIIHPSAIPAAAAGYGSQGSQTQGGVYLKPIFVPFRQETSSPDLSEVLRRKPMGY